MMAGLFAVSTFANSSYASSTTIFSRTVGGVAIDADCVVRQAMTADQNQGWQNCDRKIRGAQENSKRMPPVG